jgi:hypothetical protein
MGAQKAFLEFAKLINDSWGDNGVEVTIPYFEQAIGRAILFKDSGQLVSTATWYESGFRAQVMTYTWAKIVFDMTSRRKVLDYSDIWRRQEIPESVKEAFNVVSPHIYELINRADPTERNPAQWAKRLGCWEAVKKLKIDYPPKFVSWCLGEAEASTKEEKSKSRRAMNNAAMTIKYMEKEKEFWTRTLEFLSENRIPITDSERGIMKDYLARGRAISERQAKALGTMYKRIGDMLAPSLTEFE